MKQIDRQVTPLDCALVEIAPAEVTTREDWDVAQLTIDEHLHSVCRTLAEPEDVTPDRDEIQRQLGAACVLVIERFTDEEQLLAAGAHPMLSRHSKQHQAIVNAFRLLLSSTTHTLNTEARFDAVHRLRLQILRHFAWDDSIYRQLVSLKA